MAAFFSALFGTPLSATLFGIMVEDVGLAFSVAFVPGFAAALIAYGVSLACGISPTHFELTAPALSIDSTLLVAVLGVACALVARAFCWLLHTMEHEMPRRLPNPWVRAVVGGAAVVALSYLMGVGRYNGAGMGVITAAVEQGLSCNCMRSSSITNPSFKEPPWSRGRPCRGTLSARYC